MFCRLWPTFGLGGCCKPTPTNVLYAKALVLFLSLDHPMSAFGVAFCENIYLTVDLNTHQTWKVERIGTNKAFLQRQHRMSSSNHLCLDVTVSPRSCLHYSRKCKWWTQSDTQMNFYLFPFVTVQKSSEFIFIPSWCDNSNTLDLNRCTCRPVLFQNLPQALTVSVAGVDTFKHICWERCGLGLEANLAYVYMV